VEEVTDPLIGGIVGSPPVPIAPADAGCTKIDVWLPNKNIATAPTMNDPNATVVLDITPPSKGEESNCTEMHYHSGTPPPKIGSEIEWKDGIESL
jgi:hypothetical protein